MLDSYDIMLLNRLKDNAKYPIRRLAKELGVSTGTVFNKIKRLESEGVIAGYYTKINWEKLGYSVTAVVEVTVSHGNLFEVEKRISEMNNVLALYDVTGESDIVVITKFKSHAELSSFTKLLLSLPNVERTNTHVVLNILKEDFNLSKIDA